jgi:sugar lactone lactonase YvrE
MSGLICSLKEFSVQALKTLTTLTATVCTAASLLLTTPSAAQTISRVAGSPTGVNGSSGDNGPATAALLNSPNYLLVRADGSLLVTDLANNRVRKIDAGGTITNFAGSGTAGFTASAASASANTTNLRAPTSLAEDQFGNVYIGSSGAIQKVDSTGALTTIAGNGNTGNAGDTLQPSDPLVRVTTPRDMRFDTAGNLYFVDSTAAVARKIDFGANTITKVAGTGTGGFNGDGIPATTAQLGNPGALFIESDGSILVADSGNHRIRKFSVGGNISTIAGTGAATTSGDSGQATLAAINGPRGLARDAAGNLYVAEAFGNYVRKIAPDGIITTLTGTGASANTGDGGPAAGAAIRNPNSVRLDTAGNLYIATNLGQTIRKITFPVVTPGPSVFKSFANTITAANGSISPEGEQTVPFGGKVSVSVTAKPRHVLRVASNCDYVQTNKPVPFVPIGTGLDTFDVTVNGPCQMEATFTPLIPRANVNTEMAANALFTGVERSQVYVAPTTIAQTTSVVGKPITFKAWVTDIAGVPYPSAANVVTFKANGVAIAGCANVPLTLRSSNVIHIREANCTTSFSPAGNVTVTSEFAGDTYNFPAASSVLNHSVVAP